MSIDQPSGRWSPSPPGSGRSSPVPRASRRVVEDGLLHADKSLRRYGATVERALTSWEISPQEWADYIAFLGRLLKAIQSHPKDAPLLPHSGAVALKLAQCMNPALPSGVHQKALEVYAYIFASFGLSYLAGHLHEYLPGLSAVLSFASLSVRPGLYPLFENYIVQLPASDLRPVLKSLILSLLSALEEETSEDFNRAFSIVELLEDRFLSADGTEQTGTDKEGYFWQCLFLAIITSPSRRQGGLNYLSQKLPKFSSSTMESSANDPRGAKSDEVLTKLSPAAQAMISPEPGLLIRCFACGLSDPQVLVQRGFLDLLVTNLPLDSPLLQSRLGEVDLDELVSAAVQVLLRREMGLNRRLWSWFLGPEPKTNTSDSQPLTPNTGKTQSTEEMADTQFKYFSAYGRGLLERCLLAMFKRTTTNARLRARPFRICLSLMDRWEIGGSVVPQVFLAAIESAYQYSLFASAEDTAEVVRSASLFFDGVEATLIWGELLKLLRGAFEDSHRRDSLGLFAWIIQSFNITDEEMLTVHIPYAMIYALSLLEESGGPMSSANRARSTLDLVLKLLDTIPERAFVSPAKAGSHDCRDTREALRTQHIRDKLNSFYQRGEHAGTQGRPIDSQATTETLYDLVTRLIRTTLDQHFDDNFHTAVSLLLALHSKGPKSLNLKSADLIPIITKEVATATAEKRLLSFPTIGSLLSLITALSISRDDKPVVEKDNIVGLEPDITAQIWHYLSPSFPKYNVEAVKAIWQVQDLVAPHNCLEASLAALVREGLRHESALGEDRAETARRFALLWNHTIPATLHIKSSSHSVSRRGSAMPSISDDKQALHRQKILSDPLMLILDLLKTPTDAAFDVVKNWLHSLATLEQILAVHFNILRNLLNSRHDQNIQKKELMHRYKTEQLRDLNYTTEHVLDIFKHGNEWVWQCLGDIQVAGPGNLDLTTGVESLANYCITFICTEAYKSPAMQKTSVELLHVLLSGPLATGLKGLNLDSRLLDHLMHSMSLERSDVHGPLLNLIDKALKLRLTFDHTAPTVGSRFSGSAGMKRPSGSGTIGQSPNISTTNLISLPPPQLINCLRMGFSSRNARSQLDQWLRFFSSILPVFADAIFTNLIPLVECLCGELDKLHGELVSNSKTHGSVHAFAPESTALALLEALDMVLSRAHECLLEDNEAETPGKAVAHPKSLLGNVTSGVFRSDGPPSRSAQSNSRLTVVLSFQDAIKVSMKLWIWASHFTEFEDFDKASASTTSYNALRVRNRTRSLLEQLFAIEPLESLEVVIFSWCYTEGRTQASAALDLLHAIQGLRPKHVVPYVLDALYSRTNSSALALSRQSTQTIDLTASDVAYFLSAYLRSIEDDAMDEIWSDCIGFMRDVLSNPMPHRKIIPALLAIILLLAQKVDNTNFGEQRKMRRDLGDMFLRLLAAAFTTMPSSNVLEAEAVNSHPANGNPSNSVLGRSAMSLVLVLQDVTSNLEVILDTSDRTMTAINSMSANFIAPFIHAKSFPTNVTSDALGLLLQMAKKAPSAKSWRKELLDAFNDPKLLFTTAMHMENDWFPVLYQWCLHDKDRMPELLSRLAPPSSAGIMFGVGATAARLEADHKAQLNLRRACLFLLSSPEDTFLLHLRTIEEKLAELFDASIASSPSAAIKAELFMLCRALVLSTSAVHIAPFWPIINDNLQSALTSFLPNSSNSGAFSNISLLQACKLLDLLIALSPDEFQLHEWLYISDTIDAVYQPSGWNPSALSDQIAESLAFEGIDDSSGMIPPTPVTDSASGKRRPLIGNDSMTDKEDLKAMTRDDFSRVIVRPFLSQLSIHAYEGVYSLEAPDVSSCRRNLLEDILDLSTIVE